MSVTKRIALVVVLMACLMAGGVIGYGYAQTAQAEFKRSFPTVISGSDFGFRIDHAATGQVIRGTLLVRIQGEWHEIQAASDVTPLAKPF
jgi:hypothetical protein